MKTVSLLLLMALGTAAGSVAEVPEARAEAAQLVRHGEALIARNCGECMGADRGGLQEAVDALRRALDLGYDDPVAVHHLLADVHGQLAWVFAEPDSADQRAARQARVDNLRRVVELAPEDVEARYELAMALDDDGVRMIELTALLEIAPDHVEARFALGQLQAARGDEVAGLEAMRQAFEQTLTTGRAPRVVRDLGERLMQVLRDEGRAAEAWEIEARLRALDESGDEGHP